MKNYILIILITLILFSCNKNQRGVIVGKWDETFEENDPLRFDKNWSYWKLVFYKDRTGTLQTYKLNQELDSPKEFTYSFVHDGKTIQAIFKGDSPLTEKTDNWDIISLNKDRLVIQLIPEVSLIFKKVK